ncbi:MAG: antibiotic biosynthesis monooxygenase [Acidobacteriota bacterium]|nr:antibiotic biosynthesis monooxygenase [Acidobacteriota bacterium]
MLQVIWEYRVHRAKADAFEKYYGARGDWAQFFRQGAGYLGTTLLRDPDVVGVEAGHYATIDQWDSAGDFQRFKEKFAAEYKQRDAHCTQFTSDERFVGQFETL